MPAVELGAPYGLQVQQGHGVDRAPVDDAPADGLSALRQRQPQHSLNTEAAAARGNQGPPRAEQPCSSKLRLPDCTRGLKEAVGVRQLGEVQGVEAVWQGKGLFLCPGVWKEARCLARCSCRAW